MYLSVLESRFIYIREIVSRAKLMPKLYAILDTSCFSSSQALFEAVEQFVDAGISLLQYRNKIDDPRGMLADTRELKKHIGNRATLMMNDRADLCLAAEFDGVHVGQDDLSPESARKIVGPERWLGISTHNPEQVKAADQTSADYIAVGPVFATTSKTRSEEHT